MTEPHAPLPEKIDVDPLAPARGCVIGPLLGMVMWIAFFGGLALVVAWAARQ